MQRFFLITVFFIGGYLMSNNAIIPLEDFFRNPEMSSFQLSPNGDYISYMKPWEEGNRRMNIYIKSMSSDNETQLTHEKDRGVYGYFWLNESRLAYAKDEGGDENIHIFAVDIDGKNEIDLTPFENIQARLIDDLEEDNDHILIGLNQRKRTLQMFVLPRRTAHSIRSAHCR